MFSERLNQAMLQRQHDGTPVSLIALDLNDFKLVNDALGHPRAMSCSAGSVSGSSAAFATVTRSRGSAVTSSWF